MNEKGFKLLAIRPLTGCNKRFYKNLNKNKFYSFCGDFEFDVKKGKTVVQIRPDQATDIYTIKRSGDKNLEVSISAIIGKNGSGKSTLTEMFYLYVFLCNYKQIMIHKINREKEKLFHIQLKDSFNQIIDNNLKNNWHAQSSSYKEARFFDELLFFQDKNVVLEVYYLFSGTLYSVNIDTRKKSSSKWYELQKWNGKNFVQLGKKDCDNPTPFYTIALNYSIHGLNTVDIGPWIDRIFHKNDSYRTPLVINPKREEGNIDINNEDILQKSRLLANLIVSKSKGLLDNIVFNKKRYKKVVITFSEKSRIAYSFDDIINLDELRSGGAFKASNPEVIDELNNVAKIYGIKSYDELNSIERLALRYVAHKIDKIRDTYYKETGKKYDMADIILDNSHVTFKLQQSINFIKGNSKVKDQVRQVLEDIVSDIEEKNLENFSYINRTKIELQSIYDTISIPLDKDLDELIHSENLVFHLLPPIFDYNIYFSNSESDSLNYLSSGEKQQMYTLHTIMYHIRNLASKSLAHPNKYKHINLILDEIELYYHPELQRQFLANLLHHIEELNLSSEDVESINILVATHSPFIASDITSQNILRLDNGEPKKMEGVQSFGSNIHDLLSDGFYLSNFLGEYAKKEIEGVVRFLEKPHRRSKYSRERALKIIELIGDPIIKMRLMDLYLDCFPPDQSQTLFDKKEELLKELENVEELIQEANDQDRKD